MSMSKKVHVVHNTGFRKVSRPHLCKQEPTYDIAAVHAFALAHAAKHYPSSCVVIFEDDFTWSRRSDLEVRLRAVCEYVKNNSVSHYFLGMLTWKHIVFHAVFIFMTYGLHVQDICTVPLLRINSFPIPTIRASRGIGRNAWP